MTRNLLDETYENSKFNINLGLFAKDWKIAGHLNML